jgi:energy-coupling factor transporter transmembrane protein EcfT
MQLFRYVPGSSLLHKCATAAKLLAFLAVSIGIAVGSFWTLAFAVLIIAGAFGIAGLRVEEVLKRSWFILLLSGFTLGSRWVNSGFVTETWLYPARLLTLYFGAVVLAGASRLEELPALLARFLRPISASFGARVGLMTRVAFSAVPYFSAVSRESAAAAGARGLHFRKRPVRYLSFVGKGAMRRLAERSYELSIALRARGYTEDSAARWTPPAGFRRREAIILLVGLGVLAVAITERLW